ncbi:scarecrow-like protein 22 [Tasmannia lanceolata]|uniref:scarecrow-like protein 22 n=1 Tax=Tasmannia lanceolata TaxID=3420 RepID=UPI004063E9D9
MKGMPFNLQGKGGLELEVEAGDISDLGCLKWKENSNLGLVREPTSVLDNQRSPSPPTSTSTLSSSFAGSTDSAGVAAVSGNPPKKWQPSQADTSAAAGVDSGGRKEEWVSDLHPIPASFEIGDWENIIADSASSPSHEQSFFRLFMNDMDEGGATFGIVDPSFGFDSGAGVSTPVSMNVNVINPPVDLTALNNNPQLLSLPNPNFKPPCFVNNNPLPIFSSSLSPLPLSLPPTAFYQQNLEFMDEKPQIFNSHHLLNQQQQTHPPQNPPFFLPLSYGQQEQNLPLPLPLPPQPKIHQQSIIDPTYQMPKTPFCDSGQDLFIGRQQQSFSQLHQQSFPQQRPTKLKVGTNGEESGYQQQQQAMVDQLIKAAELIETGNSVNARGILARLNHQLPLGGKPLQRAAFYFKEALQLLLNNNPNNPPYRNPLSSSYPLDVVYKIGAYKVFSEISPMLQFANFTSNQALLEALDGFDRIHVLDFDIGLGGQWASFMQELSMKINGPPLLKITAFTSSSHDPLELGLTRDNLSHFASSLNISFEFHVVNLESFDLSSTLPVPLSAILNMSENEALAVNLPVGYSKPSLPSLLRLIKQLSPKIVVSVDRGCDRSDLPFSQHLLHALQTYTVLIDSLDAVNLNSDAVQKIEKYLISPRIESIVTGRCRAAEKMLPWRTIFASAGFTPLPYSNFTETQAECLVKRLQVRGFHVEKHQASLYLFWQRGELVSVSAWRC